MKISGPIPRQSLWEVTLSGLFWTPGLEAGMSWAQLLTLTEDKTAATAASPSESSSNPVE